MLDGLDLAPGGRDEVVGESLDVGHQRVRAEQALDLVGGVAALDEAELLVGLEVVGLLHELGRAQGHREVALVHAHHLVAHGLPDVGRERLRVEGADHGGRLLGLEACDRLGGLGRGHLGVGRGHLGLGLGLRGLQFGRGALQRGNLVLLALPGGGQLLGGGEGAAAAAEVVVARHHDVGVGVELGGVAVVPAGELGLQRLVHDGRRG